MLQLWMLALGFDWDEILMVCTAVAAAAYVIMEFRSSTDLAERVRHLETVIDGRMPINERIAILETRMDAYEEPGGGGA